MMNPSRRRTHATSSLKAQALQLVEELDPPSGEELLPFALHQVIGAATLDPELRKGLLDGNRGVIDGISGVSSTERRVMRSVGSAGSLPEWAMNLERAWLNQSARKRA
jgi:hypothetical protein